MRPAKKAARGPTAESIGFRLNEGPAPAVTLPFTATYLGEGVVAVEGVGLFTRNTRAAVDAATAERLRTDPRWEVRPQGLTGSAPGGPAGASSTPPAPGT